MTGGSSSPFAGSWRPGLLGGARRSGAGCDVVRDGRAGGPDAAGRRRPIVHAVYALAVRPARPHRRSVRSNCRRRREDRRLVAPRGRDAHRSLRPLSLPLRTAARHHARAGPADVHLSCARSTAASSDRGRDVRRGLDVAATAKYLVYYDGPTDVPTGSGLRAGRWQLRTVPASRSSTSAPAPACRLRRRRRTSSCTPSARSRRPALAPVPRRRRRPRLRRRSGHHVPVRLGQRPRSARCSTSAATTTTATPATWVDMQDSPLARLPQLAGAARAAAHRRRRGRERHPGVDCTAACASDWNPAGPGRAARRRPLPGQRFVRWAGACTGSGAAPCRPRPGGERRRRSSRPPPSRSRVAKTRARDGPRRAGRDRLRTRALRGHLLRRRALTAPPAKGWRFARWSGACRGTKPTCVLPMTGAEHGRARSPSAEVRRGAGEPDPYESRARATPPASVCRPRGGPRSV